MPNWAFNKITVKNLDDFATLTKKYINDSSNMDFNRLIPMPEALDIESCGGDDCRMYYYLTDRMTKPLSDEDAERLKNTLILFDRDRLKKYTEETLARTDENGREQMYADGKVRVENIRTYGAPTWYEWRCQHWGTKWNAAHTSLEEGDIYFDTAWSAPIPIFEKICADNPDMAITFETEYEDISDGIDVWENRQGTLTHIEHRDNPYCDNEE